MAQKVIVTMADDLDGTEETETDKVETVHFALEKHVFKIDLRKENRVKLEEALAPFIARAQPADPEYRRAVAPVNGGGRNGTPVQQARSRRNPRDRQRAAEMRDWANTQPDIPHVSERGRIPKDVVEKFEEYEKLRSSL